MSDAAIPSVAEAQARLRRLIQAEPSDPGPRRKLAALLAEQGDLMGETAALEDMLAACADDPAARARLVALLAAAGREAETLAHLRALADVQDGAYLRKLVARGLEEQGVGADRFLQRLMDHVGDDHAARALVAGPVRGGIGIKEMQMHSVRRVTAIAEFMRARSYMEIGVSKGRTFHAIDLPRKVAVDVGFRFDVEAHRRDGVDFFEYPSDDYFSDHAVDERFDVFFIDGLHTFEQTYRDFLNTLKYAHDRSVWLIDDILPCDQYSALADPEECARLRQEAGLDSHKWHGDTYKTMYAIHDLHPDLSFVSINTNGNGQSLVWRSPRPGFEPVLGSMGEIETLDYFGMLELQDVLNFRSEEEALLTLFTSMSEPQQA